MTRATKIGVALLGLVLLMLVAAGGGIVSASIGEGVWVFWLFCCYVMGAVYGFRAIMWIFDA